MFQIILWFFLLFLLAAGVFGQKVNGQAEPKRTAANEVLQLEELGRQKTLRSDPSWDDLMADGAYMIGPDGNVLIYKAGKGFPPFPVKSVTLSEMIARPFGEVVVVTGLAEVEALAPDGRVIPFKMRYMNVWQKAAGGWKIVVTERTSVVPPKPSSK
jgi:hypothetical protein